MIKQLRSLPKRPSRAVRVCVSGGIGTGKTELSVLLNRQGASLVNADEIIREATTLGGSVLPKIREKFGSAVFNDDATLNRSLLAEIVFSSPTDKAALEAMLHPLVWQAIEQKAATLNVDSVLVAEVPLITETGNAHRFDLIVTVDAPLENRLQRLVETRRISREDALRRIRVQANKKQRQAVTHLWVENNTNLDDLMLDGANLWNNYLRPQAPMWQ